MIIILCHSFSVSFLLPMGIVFYGFRKKLSLGFLILGVFATGLAVVHPAINAFVLMILGVPALVFMVLELRR